MINAVASNLTALTNYGRDMSGVAHRVSRGLHPDADTDIAKEFAQSIAVENGFSANIKAVQTQDEMVGSVLDIIA